MPGFTGFTNVNSRYNRKHLHAMGAIFTSSSFESFCPWPGHESATLGGTARRKDSPTAKCRSKHPHRVSAVGMVYGDRPERYFPTPMTAEVWFSRQSCTGLSQILQHVNGYFSAGIHDRQSDTIHLVTDRFGFKRLYYAVAGGNIVWSTDLRSFLRYPGLACSISPGAVDQFLSFGYCLEDTTWFEGIRMVPAGTHLTFHLRTGKLEEESYWSWDTVAATRTDISTDDVARELAGRFAKSVQIRSAGSGSIGIPLSGGLDSRALCAASPVSERKRITLLTFGTPGCEDIRIASQVADVMQCPHRIFHFDLDQWYRQRIPAIWQTSASCSLLDLHGSEFLDKGFSAFDHVLSGFAGDLVLGGSYLHPRFIDHSPTNEAIRAISRSGSKWARPVNPYYDVNKTDPYFIYNRVRRFTTTGTFLLGQHSEVHIPFLDNNLTDFVYSISDVYRLNSRVYKSMLLKSYSEYFRKIPWQKTGLSIAYPSAIAYGLTFLRRVRGRLTSELQSLGLPLQNPGTFVDYSQLTRMKHFLSFADHLLSSRNSLYPEYINRQTVLDLLQKHKKGSPGTHVLLSRYLTLEIWLRQILKGELRSSYSHEL